MNKELIEKVIASLNDDSSSDSEVYPYFPDSSYKPIKVSNEGFHSISGSCKGKVCFIDGGNCELLKSANSSLQLIRVYYTIYSENKRIKSKKYEFFALVSAERKEGQVVYNARFFDDVLSIGSMNIDPFDEKLRTGVHQAKVTSVGNVIRRFSELKAASLAVDELSDGDVVVVDGSLQASFSGEKELLDGLYSKASAKNVVVSGLSKTTSLLATNGVSFVNVLSKIAPAGSWYYYPVASINNPEHRAEIYFTRLHEKSKYVFRFEVHKGDISNVLPMLISNSKDPVFLGYPYGLIEADRFA
ncbi:DNA double-strand break repair nuclease NurA, partial [Nanoarchaeota archaeon]